MTTKPTLYLTPDHHAELTVGHVEDSFASLATYVTLVAGAPAAGDDMAQAHEIAETLQGLEHSSDIDMAYFPCVLTGAEPLDDSFFTALGIARGTEVKVSGYENPKLEVVAAGTGEGQRTALQLFTRLSDYAFSNLSEYCAENEQELLNATIAKMEAHGPIVGVQLCTDDGVSKIVLTLARRESGAHIGVLTVRVET
jgi:hypothetical protein